MSEEDNGEGSATKRQKKDAVTINTENGGYEVIIVEDNDEPLTIRKGSGARDDPITFTEWITGNLIPDAHDQIAFVISDSDDEEDEPQKSTSRRSSTLRYSTPLRTPTPFPKIDSESPLRSLQDTPTPRWRLELSDEEEDEDEDGTKCVIVVDGDEDDEDADIERISRNIPFWADWATTGTVKDESEEEMPGLSLSQETQEPEEPESPLLSRGTFRIPAYEHGKTRENPLWSAIETSGSSALSALPPASTKLNGLATKNGLEQARNQDYNVFKKRLFYNTYAENMFPKLRERFDKLLQDIPGDRTPNVCWLWQGEPPGNKHRISMHISFRHEGKGHHITANIGFVGMLLEGLLTVEAKEGIIQHRWHASHMCGNWRCVNPHHIIAEDGSTNVKRNACFHAPTPIKCVHNPQCWTHLTIKKKADDGGICSRSLANHQTQRLRPEISRSSPFHQFSAV